MPKLEFVGQSSQDPDNIPANTARLVNCYRETVQGRTVRTLKSVLGMVAFATLPGVFMRAMRFVGGYIYAVHDGKLMQVSSNGVVTDLGAVTNAVDTSISTNNGAVTVAAGGTYYLWQSGTLTTPGSGAIANVGDVTFMAQRTILVEAGGRRIEWTDLAAPESRDALNFATTESRDDNNLRAYPIGGLLFVLKERSIEKWQPTATGFSYLPGSTIDRGLKSYRLATEIPNGVFFVGDDNKVYLLAGAGLSAPISSRAVETSLTQQSPTDCFFYADEGHEFCVIRFADRPAWSYDIVTNEWHERAEGENDPWTVTASVRAFGGAYYAVNDLGAMYRLARTNADAEQALIRRAVSNSIRLDGNRFRLKLMELLARIGRSELGRAESGVLATNGFILDIGDHEALEIVSLTAAPRAAQVMVRFSKDYGNTWGDWKQRSMGDLGEYGDRITLRSQGQFRSATMEVSISDPAELTLDAEATVELA